MIKKIFDLFFRKKDGGKKAEIALSELKGWLDENTKDALDCFWSEVSVKLKEMDNAICETEENLEKLQKVGLFDKRANEKARAVVLSNKDSYVEHVKKLLDFLKKEKKKRFESVGSIKKFELLVLAELDLFSKRSLRNFHIASEFIGKELEDVLWGLKKMNNVVNEIKGIDKSKAESIEKVYEEVNQIEKERCYLRQVKEEERKILEKIKALSKELEELKKREEEIKKSSEWSKKEQLDKEISAILEKRRKCEEKLRGLFLSVEKGVKKFVWREEEKNTKNLLLKYLDNPVSALKEDKELKILLCLKTIKKEIKEGKFEDKRKEQLLGAMEEITKEKLVELLEKDRKLEEEIKQSKKELLSLDIKEINFESIYGKKIGLEDELKMIKKRKDRMEKEIGERKAKIEELIRGIGKVAEVIL